MPGLKNIPNRIWKGGTGKRKGDIISFNRATAKTKSVFLICTFQTIIECLAIDETSPQIRTGLFIFKNQ